MARTPTSPKTPPPTRPGPRPATGDLYRHSRVDRPVAPRVCLAPLGCQARNPNRVDRLGALVCARHPAGARHGAHMLDSGELCWPMMDRTYVRRLGLPRPVAVSTDATGLPVSVDGRPVEQLRDEWRVAERWWGRPPARRG